MKLLSILTSLFKNNTVSNTKGILGYFIIILFLLLSGFIVFKVLNKPKIPNIIIQKPSISTIQADSVIMKYFELSGENDSLKIMNIYLEKDIVNLNKEHDKLIKKLKQQKYEPIKPFIPTRNTNQITDDNIDSLVLSISGFTKEY